MPKAKSKNAGAIIHAVVGSDESEIKRVAAELAAELTPPDGGEFALETIDGCADNAEHAANQIHNTIQALQTLPFFGGGKLVWLKNANFLADNRTGNAVEVTQALEELSAVLQGGLGPEVRFLLSAPEVDKRRSFYRALTKRAELRVLDR